jgi:hypothetical protein
MWRIPCKAVQAKKARLVNSGPLSVRTAIGGNRPLEPRALEVEFFPIEEVLHEKVKIH